MHTVAPSGKIHEDTILEIDSYSTPIGTPIIVCCNIDCTYYRRRLGINNNNNNQNRNRNISIRIGTTSYNDDSTTVTVTIRSR